MPFRYGDGRALLRMVDGGDGGESRGSLLSIGTERKTVTVRSVGQGNLCYK